MILSISNQLKYSWTEVERAIDAIISMVQWQHPPISIVQRPDEKSEDQRSRLPGDSHTYPARWGCSAWCCFMPSDTYVCLMQHTDLHGYMNMGGTWGLSPGNTANADQRHNCLMYTICDN